MQVFIVAVAAVLGFGYYFLNQPQFGSKASGKRLERILSSPNYKDGAFQNIENTPNFNENSGAFDFVKAMFSIPESASPSKEIPVVKTKIAEISDTAITVVWFGHSSYYINLKGFKILVDPVFSGAASPVTFFANAFKGANHFQAEDFANLDLVLLTHDHYDHLDYESILKLKDKTTRFYTSLGVGVHLILWGIKDDKITEFDWWESKEVLADIKITATPARHFSGRLFKRNQTLWSSFVLEYQGRKIFLGGDSGYDKSFQKIGETFGSFDLAILECGQYNTLWPYIHMTPEQVAQAAEDLNAKVLMPVHWSKFRLAMHPWNEPIERVSVAAQKLGLKITTPQIGEEVKLNQVYPENSWWKGL